jgi:hypothetical protein
MIWLIGYAWVAALAAGFLHGAKVAEHEQAWFLGAIWGLWIPLAVGVAIGERLKGEEA